MTLIRPTRRDILKMAAAMPAFALPGFARAEIGPPAAGGNPSYFRFSLGDMRLTILSDGYFTTPVSGLGVNADPQEVQAFLAAHFQSTEESFAHTNHLLIETGEHVVLVDVGSGTRFFDTTGKLFSSMESAGIDPYSVTHVMITHAHPDHIWGIRDDFDEPIFPDAEYFIGEAEHGYWMQDDFVNKVPAADQQMVIGAVNSIAADGVEWTQVADGFEIVPGVRMIDTPGHTPGHMSLHLESNGEQMIALGDCMNNAYTNFYHPEWYNSFDVIGDQAVTTRQRVLDMAAADRIAVLGYHFPFPGVGHVAREGGAYRFIPANWQFG